MLVSLHEVEFWAKWAILVVSIGVAIAEWVTGVIDGGHENRVEVRNATAANIAQIDIVFDNATEKVRPVQ